jgi:hypothetical protein
MLSREQLAAQKEQFGEQLDIQKQGIQSGQITGAVQGATGLIQTAAIAKHYGLFGGPGGGAPGTPLTTPGVYGPTVTEGGVSSTTPYLSQAGMEQSMPATSVAASEGGGLGLTAAGAGAGIAGGLAGTYAPLPKKAIPFGGEKEKAVTGGVVAGAGAGALTGAAMTSWSGPGAIVGTVVGAIAGGLAAYMKGGKGKGGTVICTELLRQGLVPREWIELEHKYNFDWEVYWGYRTWADSVVRLMQRSRHFSLLIAMLGRPFLKEIAHRVDSTQEGNPFGAFILRVGVPICRRIFRYKVSKYRKALAWQQDCLKKVGE